MHHHHPNHKDTGGRDGHHGQGGHHTHDGHHGQGGHHSHHHHPLHMATAPAAGHDQRLPQPAPTNTDTCPKRGGSAPCSGECRTCPNRGH